MKIALIAHDKKKNEIIEIAKKYKDVLGEHELYATGTTGTLIMGETGLSIHRMKSGPLGGDQQIGAMLANGELDLIIFLRDPLTAQPHEPAGRGVIFTIEKLMYRILPKRIFFKIFAAFTTRQFEKQNAAIVEDMKSNK